MKKNVYKPRKDPPRVPSDSIVEIRWCHICSGFHYVEKRNKTLETTYHCSNCNQQIWREVQLGNEMYPDRFFKDYNKQTFDKKEEES